MTPTLNCDAVRNDLVSLLYDDGDVADRMRARDHLAQCTPCRTEYGGLRSVRKDLLGWSLPVTPVAAPARQAIRWFPTGLAAAAGLVLGIGLAFAGRNVFLSSPAELTARGEAGVPTSSEALAGGRTEAQYVSHRQLQDVLQAQENRYETEIGKLRQSVTEVSLAANRAQSVTSANAAKTAGGLSPLTVEKLLRASEERQARLIEARIAGLRTQTDLQRQYDMAQIAAGLAFIDSRTGADAARTSELMKNLVRVTAKPQDR